MTANFLKEKFAKKPAIAEANIKVIQAGYDYGHNTHSSTVNVYRVESKTKEPGRYMDITGNKATAYGFIAAAEKAGLRLYLGSYLPLTCSTNCRSTSLVVLSPSSVKMRSPVVRLPSVLRSPVHWV